MPPGPAERIRAAVLLWQRGVWDALQLQRCVVYFVLDDSGEVLAQTTRCVVTNGVIYLGSLVLFNQVTQPAMDWLLQQYAAPVYGAATVAAWQQLMSAVFQLLWLLPVYLISLMVSCTWYQQIATASFGVQHKQQYLQQLAADAARVQAAAATAAGTTSQQQQQQQQQPPSSALTDQQQLLPPAQQQHQQQHQQQQRSQAAAWATSQQAAAAAVSGGPSAGGGGASAGSAGGGGGGMLRVLECTAQEVYRALLFVVFTVEVYILSLVPVVGVVLNVVFLSWLYAYYCFDYKWALEGIRLPSRLHFFECNWAYFAGFGFPCVAVTVFWPFHVGAALANLLFPVFIMVACGAKPLEAKGAVLGADGNEEAPVGSLPIFKLALRPTYWLVRKVFGGTSASKQDPVALAESRRFAGKLPAPVGKS